MRARVSPRQRKLPRLALPPWAEVSKRRHAHIRRVAALVEGWADDMRVSADERRRWLRAVWLHDALKDAKLPDGTTHGPAAADRAAQEGETDQGVLDAVRYHSVGYAGWDNVGKILFLADFLEPGRPNRRRRARLARRVPRRRDAVLIRVLAAQIRRQLREEKEIDPLTLQFWKSLNQR